MWAQGTGIDSHPVYDLQGGTVTAPDVAGTDSVAMEALGDGWYRCYQVFTVPVGTTTMTNYNQVEAVSDAVPSSSFDGLDQDSLILWGHQAELGNTIPTSLIKTPAAPATRAADA